MLELSSLPSKFSDKEIVRFAELVKQASVDVNATSPNDGMNALLKLSKNYGHDNLIQLVKPLIERGIDVNATDPDGWNALHNLCRYYGHKNLLIELIQLLEKSNIDTEAKTKEGSTAFYLAVFENPAKFISLTNTDEILYKGRDFSKVVRMGYVRRMFFSFFQEYVI